MHKVGICGNFSLGLDAVGGQTIRTRIVAKELEKRYGKENVLIVDSNNWGKRPLKLLFECIRLSWLCDNIIILPAHKGVKVFVPLFVFLCKLFNKRIHYIVIGAWLAENLKSNKLLLSLMKKIECIYCETETLKRGLESLGISDNLHIMRNFKSVDPIEVYEIKREYQVPYKLCILSRVNFKKGIEDAIKVINEINNNYNKKVLTLDIYGPIEKGYFDRFNKLIHTYSSFVSYRGTVEYNQTVKVLQSYYLLLFPTKYYTEGFPGTILDGYMAGVPVLASNWESSHDIIEEGRTGIVYSFDNSDDFYEKLNYAIRNKKKIIKMKSNCLKEANKYTPDQAMKPLLKNLK